MAEYEVNRGIGRPAEFRGLTSRYLFALAGGLAGVPAVFAVAYAAGVGQWTCVIAGFAAAFALTRGIFYLNGRYGEHGLTKETARRRRPRYIINRRRIHRLFNRERT